MKKERKMVSIGDKYHNAMQLIILLSPDVKDIKSFSEIAILNLIQQQPRFKQILEINKIELDYTVLDKFLKK